MTPAVTVICMPATSSRSPFSMIGPSDVIVMMMMMIEPSDDGYEDCDDDNDRALLVMKF